eukprot:347148_1
MGNEVTNMNHTYSYDQFNHDAYGVTDPQKIWTCRCGAPKKRWQPVCRDCNPTQPELNPVAENKEKQVDKKNSLSYRNIKEKLLCKIEIQSDPGIMIDYTEHLIFTKNQNNITYTCVMRTILDHLHKMKHPMKFRINKIERLNKISVSNSNLERRIIVLNANNSATDDDQDVLELSVAMDRYHHQTLSKTITCEQLKSKNSQNPMDCSIYATMKGKYKWNEQNLKHLTNFTHFNDDYNQKTPCRYYDECKAYKRLEQGGNELSDKCHIELYRHPPRNRNIKLSQNINPLKINQDEQQVQGIYQPTDNDKKIYYWNDCDGFLSALLAEIEKNGYKADLCLECGINDDCKHDDASLLKIVKNKMNDRRHKLRGKVLNKAEMLSLILYTGCECNYDFCKTQRSGNYNKWKWFDYCLYQAIYKLSVVECGSFSVFTGLNKVKLDKRTIKRAYFVTYVSTSWIKTVAESFINNDGMIIEIDK